MNVFAIDQRTARPSNYRHVTRARVARWLFAAFGAIIVGGLIAPSGVFASLGDRDRDGLPDRWERSYGLSTKSNSARRDNDKDLLTNLEEYRGGSSPKNADTDGDGIPDADENGVVLSYEGGELTVMMPTGKLTGYVNDDTLVFCESEYAGDVEASAVDADPEAGSDESSDAEEVEFRSDECDESAIEVGREVIYADLDDADDEFFSDVTLVK